MFGFLFGKKASSKKAVSKKVSKGSKKTRRGKKNSKKARTLRGGIITF
jgi:hypothetical protein